MTNIATQLVPVTKMTRNLPLYIQKVQEGEQFAILKNNELKAYLVSPEFMEQYEQICEIIEDMVDTQIADERLGKEEPLLTSDDIQW